MANPAFSKPRSTSHTGRLRVRAGLRKTDLAERLECTATHVGNIERGSTTSFATLEAFADALGIPRRTYVLAYLKDREAAQANGRNGLAASRNAALTSMHR